MAYSYGAEIIKAFAFIRKERNEQYISGKILPKDSGGLQTDLKHPNKGCDPSINPRSDTKVHGRNIKTSSE